MSRLPTCTRPSSCLTHLLASYSTDGLLGLSRRRLGSLQSPRRKRYQLSQAPNACCPIPFPQRSFRASGWACPVPLSDPASGAGHVGLVLKPTSRPPCPWIMRASIRPFRGFAGPRRTQRTCLPPVQALRPLASGGDPAFPRPGVRCADPAGPASSRNVERPLRPRACRASPRIRHWAPV